ncbi:transcriptional regulator [Phyllobacterium sp. TAF24]|uniref:transcriptional regulator n=1 Tax=Phyllobacterium sp. TAF24 TaxID=3233068 RepID=UPI003F9C57B5
MKKVQRNFTVEYRSDRRKLSSRSNSIWGDVDLKSVAREVQGEAMPPISVGSEVNRSEMRLVGEDQPVLLTLPIEQETTAPDLEEIIMADGNETTTNTDTPLPVVPAVLKKERKARAKKVVPETVSAQPASAANVTAGKQKRGRKPKSVEGATSTRRIPVKRAPKIMKLATASSTAAVDEISDILKLEEENQRLRKLLAEKLRAENADLRKRLNLD